MVPSSDHSSSNHRHHPVIKLNIPCLPADQSSDSSPFITFFSLHSRRCLIFSVLLLQTLLLLFSRYLPFFLYPQYPRFPAPAFPHSSSTSTTSAASITATITRPVEARSQCEFGKVFVYDLPPMFNTEIYRNCDELNPWHSRCEALSNGGYGRPAAELSPVVPRNLVHAWYWTDQFALEIIFHHRILHHRCRTEDPESAVAYYIPFYAGLAVEKYLWSNYSAKDRDRHCEMVLDWIQRQQPYFNRSNGLDHFITMGRITWDFRRSRDDDWGSHCIYMPAMANITRLLIERNPWDNFDVGVPYPTGFHPSTVSDLDTWQDFVRSRDRKTLFCFAGATRGFIGNDFRRLLIAQCRNEPEACRVVDCAGTRCSNGTSMVVETFLDSEFCLQPRGDSFTRRSIFDCMLAGSIPVFFWRRTAYLQYDWFLPGEPDSYSVFLHRDEVKNGTSIRKFLQSYSREVVKKMREKVIEFIPKFVYAKPADGSENAEDVVDIAVDGVLKRVINQKGKAYKSRNK